ncbi:MAG: putative pterin-4-alpha-carbinolamine dehydratase [Pseudomonadota bacterium]|jgi:4a-hydroxytetrahydrobiopterin dehydratase
MLETLKGSQITNALAQLDQWTLEANETYIQKEWVFESFQTAVRFFVKVAELAEGANHHPEFTSTYTKALIKLTTHDANGLTTKDFDLAVQIDLLIRQYFAEQA